MGEGLPEYRSVLFHCILEADRAGAGALLDRAAAAYGFRAVANDLLEPSLRYVGERFAVDRLSLAQAFVAGRVADDFLEKLAASEAGAGLNAPGRPPVVIGNAEDDFHSLGRRMVGTFLRIDGRRVEDLGNDVLAETFVDAAERLGARVIGVSAMMLTNALNIRRVREELDRRGLGGRIKLAVGGAVFRMRPELVAEVGGDGTAATAMDAPALFDELEAAVGGAP